MAAESMDLDRVLIQHVATIGFAEVYDLMESATPDLRQRWLKQIQQMKPGIERRAALTTYFKALIQLDPGAAAQAVIDSTRDSGRLIAVETIVGAAMPSAMPEVVRALLRLPRDDTQRGHGPDYLGEAIHEWSWADPVAVSRFLEENKNEDTLGYAGELVRSWAEIDPTAARAWLDRFDPRHEIQNAELDWLAGWAGNDRTSAINYLVAHADNKGLEQELGWFASELLAESPAAATNFVSRLPDDEARHRAIFDVASSAEYRLSTSSGPDVQVAAKWLVSLPPELWPKEANEIGSVLARWEETDSEKFAAWLNQLPSEIRDRAVAQYCSATVNPVRAIERDTVPWNNPAFLERRLQAATSIIDKGIRDQALRKVVDSAFGEISTDEALQLVQQTGLASSAKQYVMDLLRKTNPVAREGTKR